MKLLHNDVSLGPAALMFRNEQLAEGPRRPHRDGDRHRCRVESLARVFLAGLDELDEILRRAGEGGALAHDEKQVA